jgi:hypothetical protein
LSALNMLSSAMREMNLRARAQSGTPARPYRRNLLSAPCSRYRTGSRAETREDRVMKYGHNSTLRRKLSSRYKTIEGWCAPALRLRSGAPRRSIARAPRSHVPRMPTPFPPMDNPRYRARPAPRGGSDTRCDPATYYCPSNRSFCSTSPTAGMEDPQTGILCPQSWRGSYPRFALDSQKICPRLTRRVFPRSSRTSSLGFRPAGARPLLSCSRPAIYRPAAAARHTVQARLS